MDWHSEAQQQQSLEELQLWCVARLRPLLQIPTNGGTVLFPAHLTMSPVSRTRPHLQSMGSIRLSQRLSRTALCHPPADCGYRDWKEHKRNFG